MTDTRIRFDPRGVRTMDCSYVLECDIVDIFRNGGGIAKRANDHGARFVTCYVRDVDVRAIAFDRYTVLIGLELVTKT
jgi:hypothetical protein